MEETERALVRGDLDVLLGVGLDIVFNLLDRGSILSGLVEAFFGEKEVEDGGNNASRED